MWILVKYVVQIFAPAILFLGRLFWRCCVNETPFQKITNKMRADKSSFSHTKIEYGHNFDQENLLDLINIVKLEIELSN